MDTFWGVLTKPFGQVENETTEKLQKMETDHKYQFICAEKDVDYIRIVKEAPPKTSFIVVEERNRVTNRARGWVLLIHNEVLTDSRVKHHVFLGEDLDEHWGDHIIQQKELFSYRFLDGDGAFPKSVYQDIEKLKKMLSAKDTSTIVEYK